ncbi:twin-arginine translocation signal domain-containing protein [Roseibium polysiphoniae]|uniref:Twin-arginine translocation signal domain-containing protein n=1 Tax=Roseibium polysiphoniae TaxID=2571221 RepID=A0ABR9C622_9HYPH|nr:twin-arginine translocation signal domain-containing protein [Roseibium polysiphoniae]MBD8875008.1 twin-arginine translocation signal domain-containing protein [Roseibium polysiphoniae]
MTDKKTKDTADRRNFLKLAGLGTLAGGASIVAGGAEAVEAGTDAGTGYRETDHVKKVYETARF